MKEGGGRGNGIMGGRRAKKKGLRAKGRERLLILREQLSGTGLWKCRDYKARGVSIRKDGW